MLGNGLIRGWSLAKTFTIIGTYEECDFQERSSRAVSHRGGLSIVMGFTVEGGRGGGR